MPVGNPSTPHGGSVSSPRGRSDLPRLSNALAGLLNESVERHQEDYEDPEEGKEDFLMENSMGRYTPSAYTEGVSEVDAENALQNYRTDRNKGMDLSYEQQDIKDAYRNRNEY